MTENNENNTVRDIWNNYKMESIIILISGLTIISIFGYILVKKNKKSI